MREDPTNLDDLRAELATLREKLAASEARADALARIAAIVDRSPDFIGMSEPGGPLVFLNAAARRHVGLRPDEDLRGLRPTDTLPERFHPLVFGQGGPAAVRDGTWRGEAALLCHDGQEIPVSLSLSVHRGPDGVPSNISAIMHDITEIKRLEDDLRAAEERLRHLLRSSPIVVYTARVDDEYSVTYVSDSITEMLGYAPADFIQNPQFWVERLHPEDAPRVLHELRKILELRQNSYDYRLLDSSGRYRWLLDQHKIVHDPTGKPIEIVGSILDITERREAEQTVMELSTPLIPVSDRVLVMPLVGRIDQKRAELVLSTLLEGIGRRRAQVAILDITGVERVDEAVASGLVKAARAVQLLGAEVVITGIRPEVAHSLVQIGVDLSKIVTQGSLQAGIAYAMRRR